MAAKQGDYAGAHPFYVECLAIYRELGVKSGIATSLCNLGIITAHHGDHAGARNLLEESLTIFGELEDRWGIADSLGNLGFIAMEQGEYSEAHKYLCVRWAICERAVAMEST
ncbi:MAG: tetratricopeptide repeat protein [SAR202 cluster bacterium]|nr:tetratricopeptide repeat protein [SAR202 cluster bacterium]